MPIQNVAFMCSHIYVVTTACGHTMQCMWSVFKFLGLKTLKHVHESKLECQSFAVFFCGLRQETHRERGSEGFHGITKNL